MFWLTALILLAWILAGIELTYGSFKMHRLDRYLLAGDDDDPPTITIVVPARNEARTLDPAMQSLLTLDYPRFDIVAVDDRSEDTTGTLLDAFDDPRLTVLHVDDLPLGWLGKNHALQLGANHAKGEWLLFTDADVVFSPATLRHAASALRKTGVDHVAATPRATGASPALKAVLPVFSFCFGLALRPWRANNPGSRSSCGIGAFNLVRKAAYQAIDGHERIADKPHDDLALAQRLKHAGYRSCCVIGDRLLSVEWYRTLPEFIRGLEKGSFAYFGYHLLPVVVATIALLALFVWPIIGLFLLSGAGLALAVVTLVVMLALGIAGARRLRLPGIYGLAYPFGALVMVLVLWNSAIRIRVRGGVEWRGTFYSIK